MCAAPLLQIDDSNRGDHSYLRPEHPCLYFHEYAARLGYAHSPANSLILNLKKPIQTRGQPQFRYKLEAIGTCATDLRQALASVTIPAADITVSPIPPSKTPDHPEYDNRMWQVVQMACAATAFDCRELIRQLHSTEAAHHQQEGFRPGPAEIQANYALITPPPPRPTVVLVDDVLTTGAHFVAARNAILENHPECTVVGVFIARRAIPPVTALATSLGNPP